MNTKNEARRYTLESLEQPNEIPYLGMAAPDFWAIAGPVAGGILLTSLFTLGAIGIALTVLLGTCGAVVVYATPDYLDVKQYAKTLTYYLKQPAGINAGTVEEAAIETNTSLVQSYRADPTTRAFTHIERFYPEANVVERTDGHLVGAIKLEPTNMNFAEDDDWRRVTEACTQFVNQSLDYDLQLWVTTRSFPIDDYVQQLRDRQTDADVRGSPVLDAVIEETVQERPRMLEEAGTELVHYYAIVDVGPTEVINPKRGDKSALEKLGEIPILGIPFQAFAGYRADLTEQRRRARMFDKVDHRLGTIESELIREIEGYDSRRVTVGEWVAMNQHFWEGIEPDFDVAKSESASVTQQPASTGESGGAP